MCGWGSSAITCAPNVAKATALRDPVVILPLAATEQHGPHLPPTTDIEIGHGILDAALQRVPATAEVWTLPTVTIGASLEHARFSVTKSVTPEELSGLVVDVGTSLSRAGVRRLVLFNSHGGNRHVIDGAALELRDMCDMLVVKANYFRFARPSDVELTDGEWKHGLHGGAVETAMMMHLRPDLVRAEAITDFPSLGARLERPLRRVGPEGEASFAWLAGDLNPQGVVGDARIATPEMGARLVRHYADVLAEVIADTGAFPLDALDRRSSPSAYGPIDEGTAWSLVLATGPVARDRSKPTRVSVPTSPDTWVDVESGGPWRASAEVSDGAREVFDLYLPIRTASDIVVGQLGQSLDGRIATESGASHFVTGPRDIERLHRLRALVDAVVVGASTVAQDDPRLTVRLVEGSSPVRVVLDPSGRLDAGRRVFTETSAQTLVVVRDGTESRSAGHAREELRVPWSEDFGFDLSALLDQMRSRGLRRVLVEGGGLTISRFLQAGLLDRLHLTVAPMIIGSGRPSITLDHIASLDQALRPACRRFTLGEDLLFDLDLRQGRA